ncbi:MAG TPA: hypothetical protein VFI47_00120 [Acidimicrobiales bacterium]|nr:hypothetical protein [Acidimicrobiales bacterium]
MAPLRLMGALDEGPARLSPHLHPRDRLHAVVDAYLTSLAAFPEGARMCLVEVYAAGPEAVATTRVALGETATLPSLVGPVERFVLTHFGLGAPG